jgi:hypothetical protein
VLHERLEVFTNVDYVDDRFQTWTCKREGNRQHGEIRPRGKRAGRERIDEGEGGVKRTIFDGNGRNGETVGNEEAFE